MWRNKAWTAEIELNKPILEQSSFSLDRLPDEILSHMLSFLDGCIAVDAAIALAATCSSLRGRMRETVGPSMQVKANLLHLERIPQYVMLLKLSVARIGLKELQVNVGSWKDTYGLSSLIDNGFLESRNLLKFKAKPSRDFNVYDLLFPTRLASKSNRLSHPMSRHLIKVGMDLYHPESLNSVVSRQCTKLKSWRCLMNIDTQTPTSTDYSISKLQSLQRVQVSFVRRYNPDDGCHPQPHRVALKNTIDKLGRLVASIPNLKVLQVSSYSSNRFCKKESFFKLQSDTLEKLDVRIGGNCMFFDSIVCPKLKLFRCRGGGCGNGVRPWHPATHYDSRDGDFLGYNTSQCSRYMTIAEQSFYGMQVPNDCVVEFTQPDSA
jgi:hypothetical protein